MRIECPLCVQSSGNVIIRPEGKLPYYQTCDACNGSGMVDLATIDIPTLIAVDVAESTQPAAMVAFLNLPV